MAFFKGRERRQERVKRSRCARNGSTEALVENAARCCGMGLARMLGERFHTASARSGHWWSAACGTCVPVRARCGGRSEGMLSAAEAARRLRSDPSCPMW